MTNTKTIKFPSVLSKAQRSRTIQKKLQQGEQSYTLNSKSNQSRKQLSRRKHKNNVEVIFCPLKQKLIVDNAVPLQHYSYFDWNTGETNCATPPSSEGTVVDVSDYEEIDVGNGKMNKIVVDRDDGNIIFGKITRNNAKSCIGGKSKYTKIRSTIQLMQKVKASVARGKTNNGSNSNYILGGYRKNPKDNKLGEYAFKPGTSEVDKKIVDDGIRDIVRGMEYGGKKITMLLPETSHFHSVVKKTLDLESIVGDDTSTSTQFSSGENYWSPWHIDDDMFLSFLSCMSEEEQDNEETMYYFVFPEYKLRVPLKPGDVIVFNPLKLHSCSNCRIKDSHIFSAYVSKKTVMTKGMVKGLDKK